MGSRPVWRVRDRASFEALRRDGRRARRGPVSVVFAPFPPDSPVSRTAFAVGRSVGSAVVRNRARRRLRAVVDDLARRGELPTGTWLVSTRTDLADVTPGELQSLVSVVVAGAVAA